MSNYMLDPGHSVPRNWKDRTLDSVSKFVQIPCFVMENMLNRYLLF